MVLKKKIFKYISIAFGVLAVPSITIAGFFVIGNLDKFRKFSVNPPNDSANGIISAYRSAVFDGAKLLLAPGFTHGAPIAQAVESEPEIFGETGFVLLDEAMSQTANASLQTFSMTFRADLGSIETGVAAAYFLNQNQDAFQSSGSPGLTYSMWGGLPFSSVTSFMGGFQHGINWANENLAGLEITQKDGSLETYLEVTQLFGDSDISGGFGPNEGIGIQQSIVNQKADLIMPVAGPQTFTAQDLIATQGNASLLIGVDSAIEDDPRISKITHPSLVGVSDNMVVFSSLKKLDRASEIALELISSGNKRPETSLGGFTDDDFSGFLVEDTTSETPGTMVGGFGTVAIGNTTNQTVGVSEAGKSYAQEAYDLAKREDSTIVIEPWLNETFYSLPENMVYKGKPDPENDGKPTEYSYTGMFGLRLEPSLNIKPGAVFSEDVLDFTNFIVDGGPQSDTDKVKIIVSSANSILLDASFSQSCYLGLANFLHRRGVSVPFPPGSSPPTKSVKRSSMLNNFKKGALNE